MADLSGLGLPIAQVPLVETSRIIAPVWFRPLQELVRIVSAGAVQTYTVATLPGTINVNVRPLVGARAIVTDANASTFASIVAAGGSTTVPVYYDGTNWRVG